MVHAEFVHVLLPTENVAAAPPMTVGSLNVHVTSFAAV